MRPDTIILNGRNPSVISEAVAEQQEWHPYQSHMHMWAMKPGLRYHRPMIMVAIMMALSIVSATAQKEFNVWCFGDSTGLDFNTAGVVPVPLTRSGIYGGEGMACIADRLTGRLLFYASGNAVWNKEHRMMPNGRNLAGGSSSTQAALIVPMPGDPLNYYLFTSGHEGRINTPDVGVAYSIVDMSADGGLGDVTTRNIPLIAPAVEKLVAVPHCNGRDFWVITHTPGDNRFHVFAVTSAGVSATPVVSGIGEPHGEPGNWLAASPNGRMLASAIAGGKLEVFGFDPCTGVVATVRVLMEDGAGYGVCFSPDNTKLYAVHEGEAWELVQYDLADNDRRTVLDTIVPVAPPTIGSPAAMQLGPDGRIYCARVLQPWLGIIGYPNAAGLACTYRSEALYMNGRTVFWGLPNVITGLYKAPVPFLSASDTVICAGHCITVRDSIVGNITNVQWLFPGGTPSEQRGAGQVRVCYESPGIYPARLAATNAFGTREAVRSIHVDEVIASAVVSVGSVAGAPGDTVDIPILIAPSSKPDAPGRVFSLRLRFNGTLLVPVGSDAHMDVAYDGRECIVTLRGTGTSGSNRLGGFRAIVGLGNEEMTTIRFDSSVWLAGCVGEQTVLPGEFRLAAICREGGARLFGDDVSSGLKSVRYDGGSGRIEVRYSMPEDAAAQLVLVDLLGRRLGLIEVLGTGEGEAQAFFDAAGLGTGIYFCLLNVGKYRRSLPVHLVR